MIKPFIKYHIKDRWQLWKQTQQLKKTKEAPVLIFTMAKVGSSSVYHSLRHRIDMPCFHIHSLSEIEALNAKALCKKNGVYPGSRSPVFILNAYFLETNHKYKVISLFRNPIERNLSAFFEAFEIHMGMPAHRYKGSLQNLEMSFFDKLDHSYCKDWFDNHFRTGIGVDIYAHPFDKTKGYDTISTDKADILLVKSSLNDALKADLVGDFCNVDQFFLKNMNVTEAKKSAKLYAAFKAHMRFSKSYLEDQLESQYTNHFFTTEEKLALYKRWTK